MPVSLEVLLEHLVSDDLPVRLDDVLSYQLLQLLFVPDELGEHEFDQVFVVLVVALQDAHDD